MNQSVVKNFPAGYGNVTAEPAMRGLDVADAAYHTAHDFPGGVPALAQRMAMSANTLAHKVGLNNTTHHLTLREATAMQEVTGDVLGSVNAAVADGNVSPNEMQECERQAAELTAALNGVLATVRGMMPRREAVK